MIGRYLQCFLVIASTYFFESNAYLMGINVYLRLIFIHTEGRDIVRCCALFYS